MAASDKLWKMIAILATVKGAFDVAKPITNADKMTDKAFKAASRAVAGDPISSDNEAVNQLYNIGRTINQELRTVEKWDENDWILDSGSTMFSLDDNTRALKILLDWRNRLYAARDECVGLRIALQVINVNDHQNVKGLASTMLTTKGLDIEARKRALKTFDTCISQIDAIMPKVNNTVKRVEDLKNNLHQFLILQNSKNRAEDVSRIKNSK
jgi:hypothetical protein